MTLEQEILDYANSYPDVEVCGFVVNNNLFVECENVSEDPHNLFEIADEDYINVSGVGEITAIVHSHVNGLNYLSIPDMQSQLVSGVDWWLVSNGKIYKYRYMQPLLGREFEIGQDDCYTLIRDCYMLAGVDLPNFERGADYWERADSQYLEHLTECGFKQVDEPEIGDIILMSINADYPNHGAIYLGDQMMLHHNTNRLSRRELLDGYWLKNVHSYWRYTQCEQQLNFTAILNNLALTSN